MQGNFAFCSPSFPPLSSPLLCIRNSYKESKAIPRRREFQSRTMEAMVFNAHGPLFPPFPSPFFPGAGLILKISLFLELHCSRCLKSDTTSSTFSLFFFFPFSITRKNKEESRKLSNFLFEVKNVSRSSTLLFFSLPFPSSPHLAFQSWKLHKVESIVENLLSPLLGVWDEVHPCLSFPCAKNAVCFHRGEPPFSSLPFCRKH